MLQNATSSIIRDFSTLFRKREASHGTRRHEMCRSAVDGQLVVSMCRMKTITASRSALTVALPVDDSLTPVWDQYCANNNDYIVFCQSVDDTLITLVI